ncbi:MAG: 16S rRNA (adenine(1518)-N(6)/adenine(1519)-N(6))-dimethyltransferase RsmA [Burkholderiales bacterium]|nr:16S rRNA (adenine(1518)-N(6)/adenine(1519)-N(6))-dimethyltransferase RsmA [Burkholderiales bacterium]
MVTHIAKKRFGQHFLVDEYIINQIVQLINPKITEFLVEIGPGLAALTKPILEYVEKLHVIELDRDIIKFLKNSFADKLVIHEGDALNFNFTFNNEPLRIVGNLPYNISTPLLFHLANYNNIIDMHFMLQKEVVERLCAKPSTGNYGRLSVMMQYKYNCSKILDVGAQCFNPVPKVASAVVKIVPKPQFMWKEVNYIKLNQVVMMAFNQRRKTIQNSLKGLINNDVFDKLNIDIKKRAENLTVTEYIILATTI